MAEPQYLPKLTTDLNIISSLSRLPNKDDKLSYRELQEKFDQSGNIIKEYVNGTLLKAIEDNIASGGGEMSGANITINSLPANRIVATSLTAAQMADGAITSGKIAAGAVTSVKLAGSSVTSDKINIGAVTENKLGESAVTTGKIANEAVTSAKLDESCVKTVNGKVNNVQITLFKSGTSTEFALEDTPTLTDYRYKATITDGDITANDKVYVEFSAEQINLHKFAPITQSFSGETSEDDGGFYIYSNSASTAITINYTIFKKPGAET